MRVARMIALELVVLTILAIPAGATTLVRQGFDKLTTEIDMVVQGRVLDLHSYWNADHNFILTDVRVRPSQVLKGQPGGDVTFTVMGGSVGEITTVIIGG